MAREMKKLVVKLDLHDDKDKKKALKSVSRVSGIDSLSVDMKEGKLTVIGDIDPVKIVCKLRKNWHTTIVTVGPAKEPEKKKEEPKKDDGNKGGDGKKDGGNKDGGGNKKKTEAEQMADLVKAYEAYNHQMAARHIYPQYYHVHSVEENPNACVIC